METKDTRSFIIPIDIIVYINPVKQVYNLKSWGKLGWPGLK